jgi:hypothetical protein
MDDIHSNPVYPPELLDKMVEDGDAKGLADAVRHLQSDLAECMMLTGADMSGNEDWRSIRYAVRAVEDFRRDFDAADDIILTVQDTLRALSNKIVSDSWPRAEQ